MPRLGRGIEAVGCFGPTRLQIVGLVRLEAVGGDTCINKGVFLLFVCAVAAVVLVHHSP